MHNLFYLGYSWIVATKYFTYFVILWGGNILWMGPSLDNLYATSPWPASSPLPVFFHLENSFWTFSKEKLNFPQLFLPLNLKILKFNKNCFGPIYIFTFQKCALTFQCSFWKAENKIMKVIFWCRIAEWLNL